MKGKYWIILMCILLAASLPGESAQAQGRFSPGYVVNLNGDTIRGYLQNTIDYNLLNGISFRRQKKEETQLLSPQEYTGFGYADQRTYKRFYLPYDIGTGTDSSFLFLRLRTSGEINLWEWAVDPYFKVAYVLETPDNQRAFLPRPFKKHEQFGFYPPGYGPDDQRMAAVRKLLDDCPECPAYIYGSKYKPDEIREMAGHYNRKYGQEALIEYPWITAYSWQLQISYPFLKTFEKDYQAYRAGLFYHRIQAGRSLVSTLHGFSVTVVDDREANRYLTMVNILPYSLSLEGNSDRIHPYVVFGPGVAFIHDPSSDSQNLSLYFPSFYLGLGNRFKLSDKRMFQLEFTPNLYGMMLSGGLVF